MTTADLRQKTISDLQNILPPGAPRGLPTEQLAALIGVKPATIRRGLCVDGHYLGLVPVKLANGRLIFYIANQ